MIIGVGTDFVDNERVNVLYLKYKQRFLNRVFTKNEISYSFSKKNPIPHLAVRWSAKEAFWKAVSMDLMFRPLWLEIKGGPSPYINILSKDLDKILKDKNVERIHLSLSHENNFSVSFCKLNNIF